MVINRFYSVIHIVSTVKECAIHLNPLEAGTAKGLNQKFSVEKINSPKFGQKV
jgi:hypothetical protein